GPSGTADLIQHLAALRDGQGAGDSEERAGLLAEIIDATGQCQSPLQGPHLALHERAKEIPRHVSDLAVKRSLPQCTAHFDAQVRNMLATLGGPLVLAQRLFPDPLDVGEKAALLQFFPAAIPTRL